MLHTELRDGVALVTLDDGKANAVSEAFSAALEAGLDFALANARAVVIAGRAGRFSAGYDLNVIRQGPEAARAMREAGARMLLRMLLHPQPVVIACTGHALAAGALILLAADTRIGTRGAFKIGLNETSIGLVLSPFAVHLARGRIPVEHLTEAVIQARSYAPDEAIARGFLDEVVPAEALLQSALARAKGLTALDTATYAGIKRRLRNPTAQLMAASLGIELNADGD